MEKLKPEQTYITLNGLKVFKEEYDKTLKTKIEKHTHTPDQIVETAEKKFVSDKEKERWNDTYTKSETDEHVKEVKTGLEQKIEALEKARVWKPSVATFEDIAKEYPEPKDTWCVITKDTNTMWIYEESSSKWIDLGHSVIHENATAQADGLMSKEDKAKLDGMDKAIADAKKEVEEKVTALEEKHNKLEEKQTSDLNALKEELNGSIKKTDEDLKKYADEKVKELKESAVQESAKKIEEVSKAVGEQSTELKKYTDEKVAEIQKTTEEKIEPLSQASQAIANELASLENMVQTVFPCVQQNEEVLERRIDAINERLVAATDDQIKSLFGETPFTPAEVTPVNIKTEQLINLQQAAAESFSELQGDAVENVSFISDGPVQIYPSCFIQKGQQFDMKLLDADGYTLEGLYKDKDCKIKQEVPFTVTEDITVYTIEEK